MSAEIPDTATDAELDARMIREVREYRSIRLLGSSNPMKLDVAEVDALLRAVDERDRLRREFVDMPDETPAPQPAVTFTVDPEAHTVPAHLVGNITPLMRTVPTRPSYVVTICDAPHPSGDALPSLRCARRADHDGVHAKNGLTWPRLAPVPACHACGHAPHKGGVCVVHVDGIGEGDFGGPLICRCGA